MCIALQTRSDSRVLYMLSYIYNVRQCVVICYATRALYVQTVTHGKAPQVYYYIHCIYFSLDLSVYITLSPFLSIILTIIQRKQANKQTHIHIECGAGTHTHIHTPIHMHTIYTLTCCRALIHSFIQWALKNYKALAQKRSQCYEMGKKKWNSH